MEITQEDIDAALKAEPRENSMKHIRAYFREHPESLSRAKYLKGLYYIGGQSLRLPDAERSWMNYSRAGIVVKKDDLQLRISWPKAARRIGELIEMGKYYAD